MFNNKRLIYFFKKYIFVLIIFILFINVSYPQNYDVTILGVPLIKVQLDRSPNTIKFISKTNGLMDYLWSVENYYYTEFDSVSFGIKNYYKSIKQGDYIGELNCSYDSINKTLLCNDKTINNQGSVQNIFTLLALVADKDKSFHDAKWFNINHEGLKYRARFLFINYENIKVNNNSVVCNNFRLDIEKKQIDNIRFYPHDYFTDHIIDNDAIRQIWVEKNGNKIIKASISIYGLDVIAKINDY